MWLSRLLPTPFRLGQEESLRRRDAPNAPRKRGRNNDVEETIRDIAEEAALISIDAAPSDSHMVNMLYSFRAQADALGAMGVFDDDTTVLGRMLKEETGGHAKLMQCIDAHISMERQNEKLNGSKPSMNESMRNDRLFPEVRSYAAFKDDAQLQRFEEACMQTELDMKDALKRVIEESWDREDAYDRIMEVKDRYTALMQGAETDLVRDVVRAVDDRFREAPIPANTGRWASKTNDPEYARIALEHEKDMTVKRTRLKYDSDESSSSMQTDAVANAYSALPPPTSVTGTLFTPPKKTVEDRKKKMRELKAVFSESEVNVLQGEEFVDNRGGVCGYLGSFAKYAALWSANNPVQAGLTALPVALAGAGAFGLVAVSAPVSIGALVTCETIKGIHERHMKGQPRMPPAIRRIQQALGIEAEVAKATYGLVGVSAAGTLTHSLGSAASQEWRLLDETLKFQVSPQTWQGQGINLVRGVEAGSDKILKLASEARMYRMALDRDTTNMAANGFFKSRHNLIKHYSQSAWSSVALSESENAIRDAVGWVWKWQKVLTNLIEPVVFIGSTLHKISNFYRDGFRPDRARLYLYCNDPENDVNKALLNDLQLARDVLPILYQDNRGDKLATWEPEPRPSIKVWMDKLTDPEEETQKRVKEWTNWFDGKEDWDALSTDELVKGAQTISDLKVPIHTMDKTIRQKFYMNTAEMKDNMRILRDSWKVWNDTWKKMYNQATNGRGVDRPVNWLAETNEHMRGANSKSLTPNWYRLYMVFKYQHRYITGGINPSRAEGAPEHLFDARASARNRPSFVGMIGDIQTFAEKAEKLVSKGDKTHQVNLDGFTSDDRNRPSDTTNLHRMFDRYYPGLAARLARRQTEKAAAEQQRRAEAEAAARAAGQPQQQPPNVQDHEVHLDPDEQNQLIADMNHGNPGPQPDLGDGPLVEDADGNLPPIGPAPIAQSPVVDEVYARLRVLRL